MGACPGCTGHDRILNVAPHERDRLIAFSRQLARTHQELRRRLDDLRNGRAARDGTLLTHCAAFCAALTRHHEAEDEGMFAELLRVQPQLQPLIVKLVEDHEMIGTILGRIADLGSRAAGLDGGPELGAITGELDGLAAIVESHFNFEERAVGKALDAGISGEIDGTGWAEAVFTPWQTPPGREA